MYAAPEQDGILALSFSVNPGPTGRTMKNHPMSSIPANCLRTAVAVCLPLSAAPLVGGCESTPRSERTALTDRPPPEGFGSWDDYWESRDREVRDLRHDRALRPQLPGNMR